MSCRVTFVNESTNEYIRRDVKMDHVPNKGDDISIEEVSEFAHIPAWDRPTYTRTYYHGKVERLDWTIGETGEAAVTIYVSKPISWPAEDAGPCES